MVRSVLFLRQLGAWEGPDIIPLLAEKKSPPSLPTFNMELMQSLLAFPRQLCHDFSAMISPPAERRRYHAKAFPCDGM